MDRNWGNQRVVLCIQVILCLLILVPTYAFSEPQIPSWIKNTAKWWSHGSVGDDDFMRGIRYLIQNGIMKIPQSQGTSATSQQIPQWVKNNAGWWADGQIADDDFVKGVQYLVTNNIIDLRNSSSIQQISNQTKTTTTMDAKGTFVMWTGSGDGTTWSDHRNWSSGKVPRSNDHILLGSNDHVTLDIRFTSTGIVKISNDASLTIRSDFNNFGDVENDGVITVNEGNSFANRLSGVINNFGIISNFGTFTNGVGNTINNRGHMINNAGGLISNLGSVVNCGGNVLSYGTTKGNEILNQMCNNPPIVYAGSDQTISMPTNFVTLSGSVTDDGLPANGKLTSTWIKLNGPGNVEFSNNNATQTKATFDAAGVYILRLIGDDSQLQASSDVVVTVRDTIPPKTLITSGPNGIINSGFAEFTFTSTKVDSNFKCSLDNESFSTCSSPAVFNGLGNGSHAFQVKAIDVFGNSDPTPAHREWTIDTTGPTVTTSSGPAANTITSNSVNFTYFSSKVPSTFECSLDDSPYSTCPASIQFHELKDGLHIFSVRAIDDLGNSGPPTVNIWKVDSPPVLYLPGNQTISAQDSSGATFFYNATAYDILDGKINLDCKPSSGSTFAIGKTTIKCSAKDSGGNTVSGSFVVSVTDTMTPIISNTVTLVAEATSSSGAKVDYTVPTALDPIEGALLVKCNPPSGSTFPIGTTVITCSTTDRFGNTAKAEFSIVVRDTTPPTVIGIPDRSADVNGFYNQPVRITWMGKDPASGILSCDPPVLYIGPDSLAATLTGNCIDKAGNIGKGEFTVKYDSTPPTLMVPSDITVQATSSTGAVVTYSFSSGDLLSIPKVVCSPVSGFKFPIGTTTVSCTATDLALNSVTKTFNVIVLQP